MGLICLRDHCGVVYDWNQSAGYVLADVPNLIYLENLKGSTKTIRTYDFIVDW
jgi:hypothetical protein